MDRLPERIYLVGPSGSGKSSVAAEVARRLGLEAIDTDILVEDRIAMPIASFFERFGEPAFRAIETELLSQVAKRDGVVVATGGGIVLTDKNWRLMRPDSVVIGLTGTPEILARRVQDQTTRDGDRAARPLLAGDAAQRMRDQLAVRAAYYARADVTIDTTEIELEQVADEVVRGVRDLVANARIPALSISTPVERSDIYVSAKAAEALPELIEQRWPSARRVWMIADDNVFRHWGESVGGALSAIGEVHTLRIPSGEDSKSLARAGELLEQMMSGGVTRRDVVVALGGGVAGDLAGFAASIALRGLPLVQVPTSLLAMVDSSVGGKTGVNMPAGKNLVGAFYQPGIVVVDPAFLSTLPAAEFRSGMAEVIKHAFIQPSTPYGGDSLLRQLESAPSLDPVPKDLLAELLRTNVAIKHSVVEADEREARLRMILNFGHTAGHAIEADGFRYRHGEAVALGMQVAMEIGRLMDRIDETMTQRFVTLIERAGLPVRAEVCVDSVLERMTRDKKNIDGRLHWILPHRDGVGVEIESDVPLKIVRAALERVTQEGKGGVVAE